MKNLFTKAGVAGFAGKVTGVVMGQAVNSIGHAMQAFADHKNFAKHAVEALKMPVKVFKSLKTMAFANNDPGFNPSISAKNAFKNGVKSAPQNKAEARPKAKPTLKLQPI